MNKQSKRLAAILSLILVIGMYRNAIVSTIPVIDDLSKVTLVENKLTKKRKWYFI